MSNPKIEPQTPIIEGCPFCGSEMELTGMLRRWRCPNEECPTFAYEVRCADYAIAAHNQLCERNRLGKAAEKFMEKPPTVQEILQARPLMDLINQEACKLGIRACVDFFHTEMRSNK